MIFYLCDGDLKANIKCNIFSIMGRIMINGNMKCICDKLFF